LRPAFLNKGDKVAVVATAKRLDPGQIDAALDHIRSWGLDVVCGRHLLSSDRLFAGTDEERGADLQWAINDPSIKAVIFGRGGYGTARIVDRIDWEAFSKAPKWLCGFSDLTVLHSHLLANLGMESLHTTMPIFFKDGNSNAGSESLRKALFGEQSNVLWGSHEMDRLGSAEGALVGGNLSVLDSIVGTPSDVDWTGKVLFIEDLTEYLYHLDRMMVQFQRSGRFKGLSGLIVGQFTEMIDNETPFGKSAYEIILEAVSMYSFPVAFGAPIGHVDHNEAVFHGRRVQLESSDSGNKVTFF